MKIEYWAGSDMLNIHLAERPSVESAEVAEGFVFDYDARGRVVHIEVEGASKRVDLSEIKKQAVIVQDSHEPVEIVSVRQVADQLGVGVRAIQKTLKQMAAAGQGVGQSNGQTSSIFLTKDEADQVKGWRAERRPGRPRKSELV